MVEEPEGVEGGGLRGFDWKTEGYKKDETGRYIILDRATGEMARRCMVRGKQ